MNKFFLVLGIIICCVTTSSAQEYSSSQEILLTNLKNPTSLYVTQEHIFVVEAGKNRIIKLNHLGDIINSIGGLGVGDYQFDTPADIDATNGLKIYISDTKNNRIQIFDRRFQYLSTLSQFQRVRSSRSVRPTQIAVNNFGELFFYDENSTSIISINSQGNKVDEYQIPSSISEVSDIQVVGKDLYILDLKSKQYHILAANGVQNRSFPLQGATQLYIDTNKEEWLIDTNSIRNSRDTKTKVEFREKMTIRDVVVMNGIFYLLTDNSIVQIEEED